MKNSIHVSKDIPLMKQSNLSDIKYTMSSKSSF